MSVAATPKRSWQFPLAIIVGPSVVFLVLANIGLKAAREHRYQTVTASDRAQVVTMADLGQAFDPAREVLQKTAEDNASLRLTYRYPKELGEHEPIAMECIIVRSLDVVTAKKVVSDTEGEVRRALAAAPGVLSWGDDSKAGVLLKEGKPVGTFYVARKDRFVFVLRITGLQLEPAQLEAVMRPKLEQLTQLADSPSTAAP
ncbi:MAG: hypothetical protein JNK82_22340 [Myxococcaceae bacterium]|nr:hypothetical protein [Myxococcaceae bacterium]